MWDLDGLVADWFFDELEKVLTSRNDIDGDGNTFIYSLLIYYLIGNVFYSSEAYTRFKVLGQSEYLFTTTDKIYEMIGLRAVEFVESQEEERDYFDDSLIFMDTIDDCLNLDGRNPYAKYLLQGVDINRIKSLTLYGNTDLYFNFIEDKNISLSEMRVRELCSFVIEEINHKKKYTENLFDTKYTFDDTLDVIENNYSLYDIMFMLENKVSFVDINEILNSKLFNDDYYIYERNDISKLLNFLKSLDKKLGSIKLSLSSLLKFYDLENVIKILKKLSHYIEIINLEYDLTMRFMKSDLLRFISFLEKYDNIHLSLSYFAKITNSDKLLFKINNVKLYENKF